MAAAAALKGGETSVNRITIPVKLDKQGRVAVPKILRDALGIKLGDRIACMINEHGNLEYIKIEGENEHEQK